MVGKTDQSAIGFGGLNNPVCVVSCGERVSHGLPTSGPRSKLAKLGRENPVLNGPPK